MDALAISAFEQVLLNDVRKFMFLDDLGRLIISTTGFYKTPSWRWLLGWCAHNVDWYFEDRLARWIEDDYDRQLNRLPSSPRMCPICGTNPALEWLGYKECAECFDEH